MHERDKPTAEWKIKAGLLALTAALTLLLGIVPIWDFLDVRVGRHTQPATVVGTASSDTGNGKADGTGVQIRLADGRMTWTYVTGWPPRVGTRIDVYYDRRYDEWMSAGRWTWAHGIRGLAVTSLGIVAAVWIFRPPTRMLRALTPGGHRDQEGA